MEPAPKPRGIANRPNHSMLFDKEKPSNAIAVIDVLTAATLLVPNLFITFALNKLEIIVHVDINKEI